jgi:hypothetical protein
VNKISEDFVPPIEVYSYFLGTGITGVFTDEGQDRTAN